MKACGLRRIRLIAQPSPGAQGAQGAQGLRGPTGPRGLEGIQGLRGPTGVAGQKGIDGIPGTSSAAFRASLDVSTDAAYVKNVTSHTGEQIIQPPPTTTPNIPNSTFPTNYEVIHYNTVDYSDPTTAFTLNTTGDNGNQIGEITVNQKMKAKITYVTTIRGNSADNYSCFIKLFKYTNGPPTINWTELPNSHVSATYKGLAGEHSMKQSCTGDFIVDLEAGDRIRAAIAITRLPGTSTSHRAYITNNTSITIVDMMGGERGIIGPTGLQGLRGPTGLQGPRGLTGVQGSTADLIIGYTHLFSDTWKYEYRLNGTMRAAWFTNYTPSSGNYTDNNPSNSPNASGVDRKGTYLKLTFTVPSSQKILVRFLFPLQPLGSATSVYNFQSTLSSSPTSIVPLRSTGIASDYYEAWTHAYKNTLNFSHNEVVQYYIDASKLDTPKAAGSTMTVYFCAKGQSLGNSHRIDFGTQNTNGSHGGVTSAAVMGIAYSLDDVPIYEPAL